MNLAHIAFACLNSAIFPDGSDYKHRLWDLFIADGLVVGSLIKFRIDAPRAVLGPLAAT